MATIQTLRAFVNERLTAAVEDIFGLLETTMSNYEEEIHRQRELLEHVVIPDSHRNKADVGKLIVRKEEQQEWRPRVDREEPEPRHVKEEQEELWSGQEGQQGDNINKSPFPAVSVKSEDKEEKAQSSQLHPRRGEESGSAQQMETESSYCCQSETEDSNDDWKETKEQESDSDTRKKRERGESRSVPRPRETI
ncbi:cilia- and flagella-associated protein 251 [Etheostoma spectabile]|uniref:cilia- and flagella-associated protein 251 n=1 Tax=Etheostoma spectabile TaxID=54343 RepID=UPI0013AF54DB|nr:cilia- and flagella-associated protein 251-like [Etheostoma spectabile]